MSNKEAKQNLKNLQRGFSLIELLVVLGIIAIMSTVSLIYFTSTKQLYKADEQGLQIVDLIQEARQRALTQRETMRVELDLSSNIARLIDENSSSVATDDQILRIVSFYDKSEVRIDTKPNNINISPAEIAPVPTAVFKPSTYIYSPAHTVCTLRFLLNGTVVDAGTSDVGANANSVGTTLYIWKPKQGSTTDAELARAITIVGSSGSVRMWEYTQQNGTYVWKDSHRSSYGLGAGNSNSNGP
jgi:prepilin-type N-terminal cleavage/methylation domain-containing protein